MFYVKEGDIRVCGIRQFFLQYVVILILNFSFLRTCRIHFFLCIMDGFKNYPSSPPPFSKPFPVSICFGKRLKNDFCWLSVNTSMDVAYFVDFAWIENYLTYIALIYKFLFAISLSFALCITYRVYIWHQVSTGYWSIAAVFVIFLLCNIGWVLLAVLQCSQSSNVPLINVLKETKFWSLLTDSKQKVFCARV